MGKFNLVDFAAYYQKGFRNHLVPITDVPSLVENFKHYSCYATYFFFSDEILTYMSAQSADSVPSIAGYAGKVWAPFLPIDLDHAELTRALDAARRLCSLFLERWQIDANALQIYFSGAKGFHLLLDTRLFGRVAPSKNLPMIFDSMRRHLAQELAAPLRDTVDLAIKDRVRLLRLPNTIHEKSKLFKILLSAAELENLNTRKIRALARRERLLALTDATGMISQVNVVANPAAAELYERVRLQAVRITRRPFVYHFHRPADLTRLEYPCAGVQTIWQSHIEAGQRNNCAIRLASELRLLGLTMAETDAKLLEWNEQNGIALSADELGSVAHSAYQHRFPYRYSCRDPIRRRFCPLPDLASCRRYVWEHSRAHYKHPAPTDQNGSRAPIQ